MHRRPNIRETEDDLLSQQEEFFKSNKKEIPPNCNLNKSANETFNEQNIDINIFEKQTCTISDRAKTESNEGFPKLFTIDLSTKREKNKKQSLFAAEMNKRKGKTAIIVDNINETSDETSGNMLPICSQNLNKLNEEINEANLEILSKMTEKEILQEQEKLLNTIDKKTIDFLKNKKLKTNQEPSKDFSIDSTCKNLNNKGDIKKEVEKLMDMKWTNLDLLEPEKLEWIGDIPDKKALDSNQPYSARFDFTGELQPYTTTVDVRSSLYHHGDEPERPGYTIQELYQLSRSQILQQRIIALNTLGNIIRKTKLGYYDKCFDGQLLNKLVESDLFFLLRFSIDDNTLISSAVYCLYYLICNEPDEYSLDKLLGVTNKDIQPILSNVVNKNDDKEEDMKDYILISCDLIKGILRTDLIQRLSYILNNFKLTRETICKIFSCLIRIARHSLEASEKIFQNDNLIKMVFKHINCDKPVYEGVKLLRILSSQSDNIVKSLVQNYNVKTLINFLELDENHDISKKEFYLLKLEILYFYKTLLNQRLFIDEFKSWCPSVIRLLLFYVQKVDVNVDNDFDFELFSGITSLITICTKRNILHDSNILSMLEICLEKWLTQLIQSNQYNFAICKAIGSIFRFFNSYSKIFGFRSMNGEFIKKINLCLTLLFESSVFREMCIALSSFSYILNFSLVTRDPENLPSLCSVYYGGREYLKMVQNHSSLPFLLNLSKYLLNCFYNFPDFSELVKKLLNDANIQNYLQKISECREIHYSWFMRYETIFLSAMMELMSLVKHDNFCYLGFHLIPLLRVDEEKRFEKIIKIILKSEKWNRMNDDAFTNDLINVYSEFLIRKNKFYYKNDLIPKEWMYKVFIKLREKDNAVAVAKVLKFISNILDEMPMVLKRVSFTLRYYYLCYVFLNDSYVFNTEIQFLLEKLFDDVIKNKNKVDLNMEIKGSKSFYDLFTELIIQYAGVSYGLPIFAKFVMFPLQNTQNVSFRKLLWFEYLHVLRVVTLPYPMDNFIDIKAFLEPLETDESLLVAYVTSISSNVITKLRNPFVYYIAVGNVNKYLNSKNEDEKLLNCLKFTMRHLPTPSAPHSHCPPEKKMYYVIN